MKKKVSVKSIFNFILVLFLFSLFAYLCFSDNGLFDLIKKSKGFHNGWIFAAFLSQIVNIFIDIYLVREFTFSMDHKYRFGSAIKSAMVNQFYSAITPSAFGGQPMQVYVMSRQGVDSGIATSALVQKFLVYQASLTFYSSMAIFIRMSYFNSLNKIVWSIAITGFLVQAIVIVTVLLFSFSQKITSKIISSIFNLCGNLHILSDVDDKIKRVNRQLKLFHDSNKQLYQSKKLVIKAYILTLIQLTSVFIIPYFIYRAFYLHGQSAVNMICAQSFVTMSSSFVPIPGASGAVEGASSIFFNPFFDEVTIKPAIALSRFVSYYFTILISMPFSLFIKKKNLNKFTS